MNLIDLTGQDFTYWHVIERDNSVKKKQAYWKCKCKCGVIKSVSGTALRNGTSTSCGCRKKEITSKLGQQRFKDLSNQQFGKLKVISLDGKDNHGCYKWLCECECGNFISVRGASLIEKNTKSCGKCNNISLGEQKIKKLLEEHNIYFEQQKTFKNCKYPDTQSLVKFDFYVDNRYIIEYDGRQHFKADKTKNTWNTEENLKRTQERDEFRNNWCKENNIPIIRISYKDLDTFIFQDIWIPKDYTLSAIF